MRIGSFHIGRTPAATVQAAAEPTAPPKTRELGASGTLNLDGYLVSDEYNRDLTWPASLKVYERMRRSDAAVREALHHIFAPIMHATWNVDPATDDPLDHEVAEFGRRAFMEWLAEPFEQTIGQALLYLPQGYQVFEVVEQIVEEELTYLDPVTKEQVTAPPRQFVTWRRFAHRRPETIWRWIVEEGELVSVQQRALKGGVFIQPIIPAEQLVVLTNEKEGDDFRGVSVLRSAYKAWWLKETVEKIAGIAYERHGVGIPVAYVPEAHRSDDAMLDRIENMLRDLRAGEFTYLVFPGPEAQGTRDGFTFKVETPGASIPDFLPFLEYMRSEIKGNMLARFAELGHGQTGARATAGVQAEIWYDVLHAVADYVAGVFNQALRRLIDKNYQVERYPTLVARDIETRSVAEYADAAAKLVSSGAAVADTSLRAAIREAMSWPDEDEPMEGDGTPPADPSKPDPTQPVEEDPTDPNLPPGA